LTCYSSSDLVGYLQLVIDSFNSCDLLGFGTYISFLLLGLDRSTQRDHSINCYDLYVLAVRRDRVIRYDRLSDVLRNGPVCLTLRLIPGRLCCVVSIAHVAAATIWCYRDRLTGLVILGLIIFGTREY